MSQFKNIETALIHGGSTTDETTGAVNVPIYLTSTFKQDGLGQRRQGWEYARTGNPTRAALESLIAELDGGLAGFAFASGLAAIGTVLHLFSTGDRILLSSNVYGGTFRLLDQVASHVGITYSIVDTSNVEAFEQSIPADARGIIVESPANPLLTVTNLRAISAAAHRKGLTVIVDNTFPTPILCRPKEFGADIITHSTTKYMDGHAVQGGGVIVDCGTFPWDNGKFPEFTEPDESYHGVRYVAQFGDMAYIIKCRMQLMRDFGCYPSATAAFYLNLGLETLAVRMKQYCINAQKVAEYLVSRPEVESVSYPGLKDDPYYDRAKTYLPEGCSGVISFVIKGGRNTAMNWMDSLKLASNVVHVADIRTCVLHPASETHRQLTDEQLIAAGINAGMIRLSVGLENVDDIIADIAQAFDAVK